MDIYKKASEIQNIKDMFPELYNIFDLDTEILNILSEDINDWDIEDFSVLIYENVHCLSDDFSKYYSIIKNKYYSKYKDLFDNYENTKKDYFAIDDLLSNIIILELKPYNIQAADTILFNTGIRDDGTLICLDTEYFILK